MSIQVESLSFAYGSQKVLQEVSFSVELGTIVGLLGPNGAGKSTLMRLLTSYLSIQQGRITICGKEAVKEGKKLRRHIGYLPEHNPLYEDMYVVELLRFFGRLGGLRRSNLQLRLQEMIARCGLSEVKHKKVEQLSKGYRQRLGLARVLLNEPKVLVLDEPTSGLDPNQLIEVRSLIRSLRSQMCVLFSTHILQEAEALCDEVILLHKGQILTQQPLSSFRSKYSRGREGLIELEFLEPPTDLGALYAIDGLEKLQKLSDRLYLLQSKDGRDLRQSVLLACHQNKLLLKQISEATQSLEDIFHQLTQTRKSS